MRHAAWGARKDLSTQIKALKDTSTLKTESSGTMCKTSSGIRSYFVKPCACNINPAIIVLSVTVKVCEQEFLHHFYFTVYHAPFQTHQRQSPHDWFTGLHSFPNHHPLTIIVLSLTERLKLLQRMCLMTPVHLHIAEGVLGRRRFQWQNPSLQQHVCQKITIDIQIPVIIGVSLSEPHTSGIALHTCMCVFAFLRPMQYSGKDLSLISNLLVHDKSFAKPICCLLSLAPTMFYIF